GDGDEDAVRPEPDRVVAREEGAVCQEDPFEGAGGREEDDAQPGRLGTAAGNAASPSLPVGSPFGLVGIHPPSLRTKVESPCRLGSQRTARTPSRRTASRRGRSSA